MANMQMSKYFDSAKEQEKIREIEEEQMEEVREIEEVRVEDEKTLKQNQQFILKDIASNIWKSSRKFDIDSSSNSKNSPFDLLVKENVIQKSLENDNLFYVEG